MRLDSPTAGILDRGFDVEPRGAGGAVRLLQQKRVDIVALLQFAQTGNVDVAMTAWTLVQGGSAYVVPATAHPPLIQALRLCASDPDPYSDPFPKVGDHIWVEGRYVLDLWHHSHAELHPLYRLGISP